MYLIYTYSSICIDFFFNFLPLLQQNLFTQHSYLYKWLMEMVESVKDKQLKNIPKAKK